MEGPFTNNLKTDVFCFSCYAETLRMLHKHPAHKPMASVLMCFVHKFRRKTIKPLLRSILVAQCIPVHILCLATGSQWAVIDRWNFETMDWAALDGFSIAVIDLGNNSVAGRTALLMNKRSDKIQHGVLEKVAHHSSAHKENKNFQRCFTC